MVNWKKLIKLVPSVVQVKRNKRYEVVYIDEFHEQPRIVGQMRPSTSQIILKLGQSPKEAIHTYVHELIHLFSDEYEVGLTESQVQKLEKAVYYLLKPGNIFKL